MRDNPYSSVLELLRTGWSMPEWYRMKTDGSYLEIHVDVLMWPFIMEMYKNYIVDAQKNVANRFPTHTFVNNDEQFGFNGAFVVSEKDGWRIFHTPIPILYTVDSYSSRDETMSLTLRLLMKILEHVESQSQRKTNQLYGIVCASKGGIFLAGGCAVYVTLELAQFIALENTIPDFVKQTMLRAHYNMHHGKYRDSKIDQFRALIYNEFPEFVVPGNCACLGVSNRKKVKPEAFMMGPHNVESELQTITMIVGVTSYFEYLREKYQK